MTQTFLSQQVPGPSALGTFTRSVDPQQLQTYLALEQAEILRLKRYNEFWRFYLGQHWQFAREGGEPLVKINYSRRLVDKIADWLVGEGMQIKTHEVLRNKTLPVIEEVWKYNNHEEWLRCYALTGGVTGDVFVLITFEQPTIQARRMNPHTQGRIRIQLLGSEQVFPTWDPLNRDTLLQVRIETLYYDTVSSTQLQDSQNQSNRNLHVLRFTQIITPTQIIEQFQGAEPKVRENVLGEIALVHVPNFLIPGEYYGLSDLDGVTELNREYNEKATDVSDIINYHAAPVTVITGAKAGNLERSPKQIWSGLPADAKVTNLELGTDLAASISYLSLIRQSMLEMTGVPDSSLGKEQPISNTSGVALHIMHQPLVEVIKRKRPQYQRGIREINYYILRIKEVTDATFKLPTDLCKNCGGKVVELKYPDGTVRHKCYMIDPHTFDFLPPEEVKIRYVRQHSFGNSVEEAPFKQVEEEHNTLAPSEWDPAEPHDLQKEHDEQMAKTEKVEAENESERKKERREVGPDGTKKPAEPKEPASVTPPKRPEPAGPMMQNIELPPEPEEIAVVDARIDENGDVVTTGQVRRITVVPTGCDMSNYLNPFETEVRLKDTLPKDELIEAGKYEKYLKMRIVSRDWVRERIPEIENPRAEKKRVEDEMQRDAATAAMAGGHAPDKEESGPNAGELEPGEEPGKRGRPQQPA